MKHTTQCEALDAPMRQPGMELAVEALEAELVRLLGPNTEYCLVVYQDSPDAVNIQAITNASVARAHALLAVVSHRGFGAVN